MKWSKMIEQTKYIWRTKTDTSALNFYFWWFTTNLSNIDQEITKNNKIITKRIILTLSSSDLQFISNILQTTQKHFVLTQKDKKKGNKFVSHKKSVDFFAVIFILVGWLVSTEPKSTCFFYLNLSGISRGNPE